MLAGSPYTRIADTTSVAGKTCTYTFTTWHPLLPECVCHGFSFHFSFFLFIAMWFMHMLSKVLNVPIVMHVNKDYYVYAYVNYDSTLHKIQNWSQKQELSDNNKENEPDIINNLCIFVPGAMNRSSQRYWSRRCLIAGCPIGTEYLGAHSAGKTLGPLSVDTWTGSAHYQCWCTHHATFFALSIIIQNLSWNSTL